jgi:hypothetical protein
MYYTEMCWEGQFFYIQKQRTECGEDMFLNFIVGECSAAKPAADPEILGIIRKRVEKTRKWIWVIPAGFMGIADVIYENIRFKIQPDERLTDDFNEAGKLN